MTSRLTDPYELERRGDFRFVTEAVPEGRVLEVDVRTGKCRELAQLRNPEAIVMLADGDLAVAENSLNGRIVRIKSSVQPR